ncbi:hypothetical protein [Halobacteriaceae bacterium SHR40]|uniref:hypothetical protein n=1 Tax=Halovenus amylolytica TaxID=2500550 RepID=UPI000FE40202
MPGILTKIVSRARSDSSVARREESTLYECQSCNIVYVATEKTDCGSCDGTVEPIQDSPEDAQ